MAFDRVEGKIAFAEQTTVPPGALVQVMLEDVGTPQASRRVIAEATIAADGPQPIEFVMEFASHFIDPNRRYAVSARINDRNGRLLWVTGDKLRVLTQGNPHEIELVVRRADVDRTRPEPPRTVAVSCGDFRFTAQIEKETARLFLPNHTLRLPRDWSAPGTKYEHAGNMLRIQGNAASVETSGKYYRVCEVRSQ